MVQSLERLELWGSGVRAQESKSDIQDVERLRRHFQSCEIWAEGVIMSGFGL